MSVLAANLPLLVRGLTGQNLVEPDLCEGLAADVLALVGERPYDVAGTIATLLRADWTSPLPWRDGVRLLHHEARVARMQQDEADDPATGSANDLRVPGTLAEQQLIDMIGPDEWRVLHLVDDTHLAARSRGDTYSAVTADRVLLYAASAWLPSAPIVERLDLRAQTQLDTLPEGKLGDDLRRVANARIEFLRIALVLHPPQHGSMFQTSETYLVHAGEVIADASCVVHHDRFERTGSEGADRSSKEERANEDGPPTGVSTATGDPLDAWVGSSDVKTNHDGRLVLRPPDDEPEEEVEQPSVLERALGRVEKAADDYVDSVHRKREDVVQDALDQRKGGHRGSVIVVPHALGSERFHDPVHEALAGRPLPLVRTPSLVPVLDILNERYPHLADVSGRILDRLAPREHVALPPLLLVGPPGSGKTSYAMTLASLLGLPNVVYDGAGTADAMPLGSSHKWHNGGPGMHLRAMSEHGVANPAIVIDEIEKVGGSPRNGDLKQKLLALFEPGRAESYFDVWLEEPIDASHLIWISTANSLEGLSAPLLDRMVILRCPEPGPEHLQALAPQLLCAEYASRGLSRDWCTPLDAEEIAALATAWQGGSLRTLKAFVAGIVDTREGSLARA